LGKILDSFENIPKPLMKVNILLPKDERFLGSRGSFWTKDSSR
jgi:hypothetical protein